MKNLREYYYKSPGNPDRICEIITERVIADIHEHTQGDFQANIKTIVKNQVSVIAGKVYCGEYRPDTEKIVEEVTKKLGYNNKKRRFSSEAVRHINLIEYVGEKERFPKEGFITTYGYACDETPEGLPLGYIIAKEITHNIVKLNTTGPDITTYVTMKYEGRIPIQIHSINIEYSLEDFEEDPKELLHDCEILFNGKCEQYMDILSDKTNISTACIGLGGPDIQVGALGGTIIPTGFGNILMYDFLGTSTLSNKRLSSWVSRGAAKSISKTHMCNECLIEVSYDIENNEPVKFISKFNNVVGDESFMESNLQDIFHFNKDELNKNFNLEKIGELYKNKKEYFGEIYMDPKDKNIFPWEKLDKAKEFTPF